MILHSTLFSQKDLYSHLWYIRHNQSITIHNQDGIYNGDYFNYITYNSDFSIPVEVL